MTSLRALLVTIALAAAGLAGCVSEPTGSGDDDPAPAPGFSFDYEAAKWPTGAGAVGFVESYVMTHPYRVSTDATQSFLDAARADLAALLQEDGLMVVEHDYGSGVNILGIKNGTVDADQWIVLSAHYDTTETTVYGAWDDGAGVAALIELADATQEWEFPYTVVFAFFDEEEQGLVGSQNFVKDYLADSSIDLVANVNLDPPGLNWPCGDALGSFPVKIIHNMIKVEAGQLPRYAWLHAALEHGLNATEVPMVVRDYSPGIPIATAAGVGLRGTSDHANFDRADIANVFLGGTPTTRVGTDEAGAAVLTYALHTPIDTLEQMEARCTGGEGDLAAGFHTTVTVLGHTLVWMAQNPPPAA